MKKILALVVAFALCFTAVAGCLTASAEGAPKITVEAPEVAPSADVTVAVSGENFQSVDSYLLTLTFADGFVIKAVEGMNPVGENGGDYAVNGTSIKLLNEIKDLGAEDDGEFTFNITVTAPAVEGSYNVTAAIEAGTGDANPIDVEVDTTKPIVVKAAPPAHTHDWKDGVVTKRPTTTETGVRTFTCECGETNPVEIPVATIKASDGTAATDTWKLGHNLALDSSIKVGFLYRKAFVDEAVDVYAVINKDVFDVAGNVVDTETTVIEKADFEVYSSTRYRALYSGVAAKEMGTVLRAEMYRELADGTFECVLDSYAISDYVNEVIASPVYGPTHALAKLGVDTLCYGAAAQNYFGYNTANLVTDDVADYLYLATEECPDYTSVADRVDNAEKTIRLSRALELNSEIAVVSDLQNPDKTAYTGDVTALKAKVVYGFEGAENTVWIDGADFNYVKETGFYRVNISFLGAAEMAVPITISIYNGETLVSDTISYSVESYAADVFASYGETHNLNKLMVAILKYGASAKAFLG